LQPLAVSQTAPLTETRFCAERVTASMTEARIDTICFMTDVFLDGEFFLTSSMRHPAYVSSKIDSVNSGSIALCRSVRKSVLI